MDSINKTLYIPLYGKALVSRKGILLSDKKAEEIWAAVQFPLKRRSSSKWLAYYLGMRAAVFDGWLREKMQEFPDAPILHLGCGLDSRVLRIGTGTSTWYDVDFPAVTEERKRHYTETEHYRMIGADIQDGAFLTEIAQAERATVLLEGVSMYLADGELARLFAKLRTHFSHLSVLVDCYTPLAAKLSKWRNPIKDVGDAEVYGIADPLSVAKDSGLPFLCEHEITPRDLQKQLKKGERFLFGRLYAGRLSKKLYKLYEYGTDTPEKT